jgi:crotonobetainyl-CoA:carnitine CoA-transferase CaiB-like acyl-CoA transferase
MPQLESQSISEPNARAYLKDVTVLELGHALAGPYGGAILADLGARVIKVEPLTGDLMRQRGALRGISYPFQMIHRNKYSTSIDIKSLRGAETVRRLMDRVDIVIENFRPGTLKKYGLDAENALKRVPHLVYCSISGFGKSGPLAAEPGVDLVAQGLGGLMSVTGVPGAEPVKAGFPVADLGGGMWSVIGVLAALHRARATGQGSILDIALSDTILAWGVWEIADYQMTGIPPGPLGSAHRLVAPYRAYECTDAQWLNIAGLHSRWRELCTMLQISEIADDPRFVSESSRFVNRNALDELLAPRFRTADRDTWISRLRNIGIPCGPINNIEEAMRDTQFLARDMWRSLEHEGTTFKVANTPIHADGAPGPTWAAPELGTHTSQVLQEFGFSEREICALIKDGVVGAQNSDVPEGALVGKKPGD